KNGRNHRIGVAVPPVDSNNRQLRVPASIGEIMREGADSSDSNCSITCLLIVDGIKRHCGYAIIFLHEQSPRLAARAQPLEDRPTLQAQNRTGTSQMQSLLQDLLWMCNEEEVNDGAANPSRLAGGRTDR